MGYRIDPCATLEAEVRRVADEQVAKALDELDDPDLDVHETVHQVRKRCKKLRGLLRLVRPEFGGDYAAENASFRNAGRLLSSFRDATSLLGCFDRLMKHYEQHTQVEVFAPLREVLVERRADLDVDEDLERFATEMKKARRRLERWRLDGRGFESVRGGLEKTYRRACKAMDRAYEQTSAANFHEWRKRAKYHWYHIRLLKEAWPEALAVQRDALDELCDLLGDAHDLALLGDAAREGELGEPYGLVQLIEMRRSDLQALAHPAGKRLFCAKPKQLGMCIERYWHCRLEESALPPDPVC